MILQYDPNRAAPVLGETRRELPIGSSGGVKVDVSAQSPAPPASSGVDLVGTAPTGTATKLIGTSTPVTRYVEISAGLDNTGRIYLAFGAVAPSGAGKELDAGDVARIEIDDASKIYVVGSASGQTWRAQVL